jgi:arabinofuranosyltransferase
MLAALLLAILGIILHAVYGHSWTETSGHAIGSDDAYISYRYARNLFDGHGLVYNPGERVEGYSNFLYILLVAPAFWLSTDFIYPYSVGLNAVLLVVSVLLFYAFLVKRLDQQRALIGAMLLAINPFIWANAATGLETMLVLVSVLLIWITVERYLLTESSHDLFLLYGAYALSILCRIDGFLVPLFAIIYLVAKSKYRAAFLSMASVLATLALYTLWRLYYYDDFIGNTYYAKVSGTLMDRIVSGITYLVQNAPRGGLWIYFLVILGTLFALAMHPRNILKHLDFPIIYCVAWLNYLVYIGGDIYYERFFIGIFPMAIFLLLRPVSPKSIAGLPLKMLVALFLIMQVAPVVQDGRFAYSQHRYDGWKTLGVFLEQHRIGKILAIDAAGKVPYFSNLATIDMLGLNDKHIGKKKIDAGTFHAGHNKFDPQYVLARKPDLIAAWIQPNLDLGWGLSKDLYTERYALKYLVNLTRDDQGSQNIIDVSAMPESTIKKLIASSHGYAVMERR